MRDPAKADGMLSRLTELWREVRQPRYAEAVASAEAKLETASPAELVAMIEQVGRLAGELLWSVASVAGSAWKIESAFARFFRAHLAVKVDVPYQQMLIGLPGTEPELMAHAVHSADWFWPTAGESGPVTTDPKSLARHAELRAKSEAAAEMCRATLAGAPELVVRFDRLLEIARRYAVIREHKRAPSPSAGRSGAAVSCASVMSRCSGERSRRRRTSSS
jgi:rifampicin phosphotransferase